MTLVKPDGEQSSSKTAKPSRSGPAKKGPTTRQSGRLRGKSISSLHVGSVCDNSRVSSISTGKRNPGSNASLFSLTHRQARDAQRQADTSRHYKGLVAVHLNNREFVLGKYIGGWKFHCDDPEPSCPAILF